MIVADAGPLIAFSRIGRLSLLQHVVGQVVIPDAVYAELTERGRERPGALAIARETWIQRQTVDDRSAREEAEQRGIEVIGSLWILAEAKRRGLITEVRPLIDALLTSGYWMHPELVVRLFLEAMGEG